MGGVLNCFPDIRSLMKSTGYLQTSPSVLLNVSCYKKHEYIWFMGGDLNGFQDINRFMK